MGKIFLSSIPGIILAFLISGLSYFISKQVAGMWFGPGLDMFIMSVVFGLIAGLILSKFAEKYLIFSASSALSKDILVPIGLVLYGTQINWKNWESINPIIFAGIVAIMFVYFLVIPYLNKRFGVNERITSLTCVGSCICGAAAIAVTSPFVEAEDEDTSAAMITILIIGFISVFSLFWLDQYVYPLTGNQYASQIAVVHNQTGLVKMGAGFTHDSALVNTALTIKGIRTSLIIPLAFVVVFMGNFLRRKKGDKAAVRLRSTASLIVLGLFFFGASLLFSFYPGLGGYVKQIDPWFKIIFGAALASIGFACNANALMKTKLHKNILSALAGWVVVVIVSYLVVAAL